MVKQAGDRIVVRSGELIGPVCEPVNPSQGAPGSIHTDSVATGLGFRGGTIAGSLHMDQFVPVLLQAFGDRWLERGTLSMYFRNATTDGEPVRAIVSQPPDGATDAQVTARMERDPDDMLVMEGTASVGDPGTKTALDERDLRLCDPSELRILREIAPGKDLSVGELELESKEQRARIEAGTLTEALPIYGEVASPSTAVGLLWRAAIRGLWEGAEAAKAVGLFGAIEVRQINGPLLLDRAYDLTGEVIGVGQSPKTEYVWFESYADAEGKRVAEMRMQLRWMKASSELYQDD